MSIKRCKVEYLIWTYLRFRLEYRTALLITLKLIFIRIFILKIWQLGNYIMQEQHVKYKKDQHV